MRPRIRLAPALSLIAASLVMFQSPLGLAQAGAAVEAGLPPEASLRRPLAFAISCFLVWGFAYDLLDLLNKHFQETLHIGKADPLVGLHGD